MVKKLTLLAMVVGAIAAVAAPAAASAAPSLTMPAKTLVPVGTRITATSSNTVTKTALGNLTCEEVMVEGEVKENTGTSVHVVGVGGTTGNTTKGCKLGSTPITIDNPELTTLKATSSGVSVALSFTGTIGVTCVFSGTETGTYESGKSVLHVAPPGTLSGGCGSAELTGDFSIETPGGGAVILD